MASAPDDSAVRSTLGSYRLLGEVGRDPLGVLHLACPAGARGFPRWAVVRRMHSGLARDPVMVHAFLAATQAAVRMVHRNIVSTFDFGGKMTLPWVAREQLFGATMIELIEHVAAERAGLPWQLAVHLVAEAAEGVAALRARLPAYGPPMGFLTGAVAPSVFVTEAGHVKIIDGCLPLIEGLPLIDSRALPYRPPGPMPAGSNTGRADAFGLGVILWELVAGRRLFAGRDDEETNRLLGARAVPGLLRMSDAPGFVDEAVERAIGKSAEKPTGFASAADLATALHAGLAAEGTVVPAGQIRALIAQAFPQLLADQRAALAEGWLREQAIQEQGDVPPDVTSEAELTRPNYETVRDTTTETAISRRAGSFGDGFDDVPTMPQNRVSPSSWRPEGPPNLPPLLSVPRIDYLPETPPPPSTQPSLARVAEAQAAGASRTARTERPPPLMPPVERPMMRPPDDGPSRPFAPALPAAASDRPSLLVLASIGFGLALAFILAVGLYRDASPDLTPPATPTVFASDPAHAAPPSSSRRPAGPWTALPTATIPVTSPDDLPRAPDTTSQPGLISHRPPASARPSGRTGLLTVFCTPACDQVMDGARALGPSPVFKASASVGPHRLRLRVDSVEKTVSATVRENETTVVRETVGE
jgi:hypothetical protein